jgi:hypothetical protein
VSRDTGFEMACAKEEKFKYCKDIEEAINYTYSTKFGKEYEIIHKFLIGNNREILQAIKASLEKIQIRKYERFISEISILECHILDISFNGLEIDEFNLIDLSSSICEIEMVINTSTYIKFHLTTSLIASTFHDNASTTKKIPIIVKLKLSFENLQSEGNLTISSIKPDLELQLRIFSEDELWNLYHRLTPKILQPSNHLD